MPVSFSRIFNRRIVEGRTAAFVRAEIAIIAIIFFFEVLFYRPGLLEHEPPFLVMFFLLVESSIEAFGESV